MRELMTRSAALMLAHATQKGVTLVLQYHPEGAPYDPARQSSASTVSPTPVRETPRVGGFEDVASAALLEEGKHGPRGEGDLREALAVSLNTYNKLHMNQQRSFESSFNSVGNTALTSVVDSFER
eukprot:gene22339-25307_t